MIDWISLDFIGFDSKINYLLLVLNAERIQFSSTTMMLVVGNSIIFLRYAVDWIQSIDIRSCH
jgi:hypothetical protein